MISTNDPVYPVYEDMAAAEFKMQLVIENPGLYNIEELAEIQREYVAACQTCDTYLQADFHALPKHAQQRMLQLFAGDQNHTMQFWHNILAV